MSDELVAGLQVRVSPLDGSKSYSLRYRDKTGRQKRYTLGRGTCSPSPMRASVRKMR